MGVEIERKFLVSGADWRPSDGGTRVVQGYLTNTETLSVRVRLKGSKGYLTIKGAQTGATRAEFEYGIPADEALQILETLCPGPRIDKVRYEIKVGDHIWEVDEFAGDNAGLIVAEVELGSEDEVFEKPGWLGEEVTHLPRYLNANLTVRPFNMW